MDKEGKESRVLLVRKRVLFIYYFANDYNAPDLLKFPKGKRVLWEILPKSGNKPTSLTNSIDINCQRR